MTDGSRLRIRPARLRDLDAVVALRVALLREYHDHPIYGRLREDADAIARPVFAAQLGSSNETTFLAELGDEVVGILRCVETAASPLLVPDRYCYVSSVYVQPAHRRRGILRALLARASEWCQERDLSEMRLHNVGTSAPAAGAWESFGFEVVEQVRVRRVSAPEVTARPRHHADRSSTLHS